MGCANTRACQEEATIETHSTKTGFEAHTAEGAVAIIRSYSTAKFILPAQFKAISTDLNLNSKETDKEQLNTFYEKLTSSDPNDVARVKAAYPRLSGADMTGFKLIHEEQLVILAVLLSRSSPKDKATTLFKEFDDNLTGVLSEATVKEMFKLAFKIALEDLPLLYQHPGDDVKKYITKGVEGVSKAITEVWTLMGTESAAPGVKRDKFVKALVNKKEGILLSAAGLREFAVGPAEPEPKLTDSKGKKGTDKAQTAQTGESAEVKAPADTTGEAAAKESKAEEVQQP